MSDIEQRLNRRALRPPGPKLDDRIETLLDTPANVAWYRRDVPLWLSAACGVLLAVGGFFAGARTTAETPPIRVAVETPDAEAPPEVVYVYQPRTANVFTRLDKPAPDRGFAGWSEPKVTLGPAPDSPANAADNQV